MFLLGNLLICLLKSLPVRDPVRPKAESFIVMTRSFMSSLHSICADEFVHIFYVCMLLFPTTN